MNSIFEYLIDNSFIETKKLKELGCDYKAINDLIELGILKREKRGIYVLSDVENLYQYGMKLVEEKKFERASACFVRCHNICPSHPETCFQLFSRAIKLKQYYNSLKYFDVIFASKDEEYNIEARVYLLLLNQLTTLPKKYKDYMEQLSQNDILIRNNDNRYTDENLVNKMRLSIYRGNFSFALNQLDTVIGSREEHKPKVQDLLLNDLLLSIVNRKTRLEDNLLEFRSRREYKSIVSLLREKEKMFSIEKDEQYCLKLIERIYKMTKSHSAIKANLSKTDDVYKAIDNGHYSLALQLVVRYNADLGISNSLLVALLNDINNLVNKNIYESNIRRTINPKIDRLMSKKGAVILNQMSLEDEKVAIDIVSKNDNINWIIIGKLDQRRIVLIYKNDNKKKTDSSELLSDSKNKYRECDYKTSIIDLKHLISITYIPRAYMFEYLGFSCFRNGDIDDAITYLTIADDLYKKEGNNSKDFSQFIKSLKQKKHKINKEHISEFIRKEENKYVPIAGLVLYMMNDGYSLADAFEALELDYKTTLLTKLYVARECCYSEDFDTANQIFDEIEKNLTNIPGIKQLLIKFKNIKKDGN